VFAEADMKTGAVYVLLSEGAVARTVDVSDVIMVDIDDDDVPLGIEFAVPVGAVGHDDWYALAKVVPEVKEIFAKSFPA
jgi:uncharacterized protein YuzE